MSIQMSGRPKAPSLILSQQPPPHYHPIATPLPPHCHPIATPSPPHRHPITTPATYVDLVLQPVDVIAGTVQHV